MFKLILVVCLVSSSFADEFKAGISYLKFNYIEYNNDGDFLNNETNDYKEIDGYLISYRYDIGTLDSNSQINSLKLELRYNEGKTVYDGILQNISTNTIVSRYQSITKNKLFEPKLTLQRTTYTKNYDIGLFFSYGIKDWTRDMSINPYGFKEIYNWQFYDFGFDIVAYDGAWELGVKAARQKALDPTMKANIDGETTFDLGETKGYYYKIPLGYNINKNIKLELEYEYNKWNIGKSKVVNNMYQPQSETNNKYLSLNIVCRF